MRTLSPITSLESCDFSPPELPTVYDPPTPTSDSLLLARSPPTEIREAIRDPETQRRLNELLSKHRSLLSGELGRVNHYQHRIEVNGDAPPAPKHYPVAEKHRARVAEMLRAMEQKGVIEKRSTPYINPLVVVVKPNGKLRLCLDGTSVNAFTVNDHNQPLTVEDIVSRIGNRRFYSKFDVSDAYWQIPLAEESVKYTGFNFDGVTYCFQRMPFGIKTAGASFTRALDAVISRIHYLRPYIITYLDDIFIMTNTLDEHIMVLDALFNELYRVGFRLNRDKCEFLVPRVKFLGRDITQLSISMDADTREAIAAFPRPRNVRQVQSFLRLANWDRRFVPRLAAATRPLEELHKKDVKFVWKTEQDQAFKDVKKAFDEAEFLFLIDPSKHFGLETDASTVGLGARLFQFEPHNKESRYTVAYASRALTQPEQRYTTTEQEALALKWALSKFRTILEGRTVHVRTDHSALRHLATCAVNSKRIARWIELFAHFDLQIEHVSGFKNTFADALSRNPVGYRTPETDYSDSESTDVDSRAGCAETKRRWASERDAVEKRIQRALEEDERKSTDSPAQEKSRRVDKSRASATKVPSETVSKTGKTFAPTGSETGSPKKKTRTHRKRAKRTKSGVTVSVDPTEAPSDVGKGKDDKTVRKNVAPTGNRPGPKSSKRPRADSPVPSPVKGAKLTKIEEKPMAALQITPTDESIDPSQWVDWLVQAQLDDVECQEIKRGIMYHHRVRYGLLRKICSDDGDDDRVVVPHSVAWRLIREIHRFLVHFGTDKVLEYVREHFEVKHVHELVRDVVASVVKYLVTSTYTCN